MRVKPPRVPRAAQVAFSASQGPRVVPGTYTVRITRGSEVVDSKLVIGIDKRGIYDAAGRKQQFDAVMKAHKLFEDMSKLVDQMELMRQAVRERDKALPDKDELVKKLRALNEKLDDARKLIVATKEGGAITGEERIREHLDNVYGAINGWDGKPAKYQVDRIDALRKELDDARKQFETVVKSDARPLDSELEKRKLQKLPALSELAGKQPIDRVAWECVESRGNNCGPDSDRAARSNERD
jgi:hypothetical protein